MKRDAVEMRENSWTIRRMEISSNGYRLKNKNKNINKNKKRKKERKKRGGNLYSQDFSHCYN